MSFLDSAKLLKPLYPWMSWLVDNFDLDSEFRKIVAPRARLVGHFNFDPYQYDLLLGQLSATLDRCLSYRREFNDLAATGIQQAFEYKPFKDQLSALRGLDAAPWISDLKTADAANQMKSKQQFSVAGNALGRGFATVAKGASELSALGAAAEQSRRNLTDIKWDVTIDYQTKLEECHSATGHPLNYVDRARRVRTLLLEDFSAAVDKAFAVDAGLRAVHGIQIPPAWTSGTEPLDELVLWTRECVRQYQQKIHFEFETHIYCFIQAQGFVGGRLPLVFDTSISFMSGHRIKAIGARFFNAPTTQGSEYLHSPLRIHPPRGRGVALLPNVTLNWPETSSFYSGPSIFNLPVPTSPNDGWVVDGASVQHPASNVPPIGEVTFQIIALVTVVRRPLAAP